MKRVVFVLLAILIAGCVTPVFTNEGDFPNRLYWVANEAPTGSQFIMFADVGKLSANPTVIKQLGVPPELSALGLAIRSMRGISAQSSISGPEIIILEGVFDLTSVIPIVSERISQASGDELVDTEYAGYTIKATSGPHYFSNDNKVYLGKNKDLKEIIDIKNGGSNALPQFEEIISRLPKGDFLMSGLGMGGGPKMMGVSATVEGNIAHTTFIGKFESAEEAQKMSEEAANEIGGEGVTIISTDVDGLFVTIVADLDLTKGAGPFGEMGAPPNPEEYGHEIRECMESAKWECEDINWKCQDLVDDKCRDLSWECEDQMNECYEDYDDEYNDRMHDCAEDDHYDEQMRACWPDDWEERMNACYDQDAVDAEYEACYDACNPLWEEEVDCEDLYRYDEETDRACNAIQDEYNTLANAECDALVTRTWDDVNAECNTLRDNYNAQATTECDVIYAEGPALNKTQVEMDTECNDVWTNYNSLSDSECNTLWDDYNYEIDESNYACNNIRDDYNYQANDECNALWDASNQDSQAECDARIEAHNEEVEACNAKADSCNRELSEKYDDLRWECEDKINKEFEEAGQDCQRAIEKEWNQKRRTCERSIQKELEDKRRSCERGIDQSCWDEVNACHEEAMQACQPEIDACYQEKEQECAGAAGVEGFEHKKPVPIAIGQTKTVRPVEGKPVLVSKRPIAATDGGAGYATETVTGDEDYVPAPEGNEDGTV